MARAALVDRARAPRWYHPALGLLVGGLIAAQAAPTAVSLAVLSIFCVGLVFLTQAYQRHTGMWISGMRKGRTRWVALATAAVAVALMLGGIYLQRGLGIGWAPLAAGPIAAVLVTAAGFVWEAAYRADLGVELHAGGAS
ncbi:MAG TPA: hypothetical protein VN805_04345 [Caulobacteraceae bacterium]|nr:hypothetical protein [Caulobacteraceae bacterium]